ncbi:MAG: substrate-binding domain-containing protein [Dehalobacterium sp.]
MFKTKHVLGAMLMLTLFFSLAVTAFTADGIKVKFDGRELALDVAPVVSNGSTLVPISAIAGDMGGDSVYNPTDKTIVITTADNKIELKVDSKNAKVNGAAKTLEVAAKVINGRTMIPLRFVGEALGAEVSYSDSAKTVTITYFNNMSGTLKIGGSTTIQPLAQAAADKLMAKNKNLSITVAGGGSGEGIKGAHAGTFNIGNASRDIVQNDYDTYPGIVSHTIGYDGIVIVVNSANQVSNLTKQQVFDIFTGKIKNWKEVGGSDAAIFVQTREASSGTLGAFKELALDVIDKTAAIVETATPHTSNGLLKQAVAQNTNAIGFLSMGYLDNTVKAPKVDGVEATQANAMSKAWPFVRSLNVVTKGTPSGLTAKFINYLRSFEGQLLVSADYLPIRNQD